MAELTEQTVLEFLSRRIPILTGRRDAPDFEKSLSENGINSMGFIELLLAADHEWNVSLVERGITSGDVATIRALARRIVREANKSQPGTEKEHENS